MGNEPTLIDTAKVWRGSIRIPKDVREKLKLKDGDKVVFKSISGIVQTDEKIIMEKV